MQLADENRKTMILQTDAHRLQLPPHLHNTLHLQLLDPEKSLHPLPGNYQRTKCLLLPRNCQLRTCCHRLKHHLQINLKMPKGRNLLHHLLCLLDNLLPLRKPIRVARWRPRIWTCHLYQRGELHLRLYLLLKLRRVRIEMFDQVICFRELLRFLCR